MRSCRKFFNKKLASHLQVQVQVVAVRSSSSSKNSLTSKTQTPQTLTAALRLLTLSSRLKSSSSSSSSSNNTNSSCCLFSKRKQSLQLLLLCSSSGGNERCSSFHFVRECTLHGSSSSSSSISVHNGTYMAAQHSVCASPCMYTHTSKCKVSHVLKAVLVQTILLLHCLLISHGVCV
jgi:hypothetical protein